MTGSPSFGSSIMKVWLLMRLLISLRVAFNPGFLIFSANLVTSAKFLGSGMKWDTYEPVSPKLVSSCEISDTIVLKILCKPFPILCVALNAPFHCDLFCLIRARIARRESLLFIIIDSLSDLSSLSVLLRVSLIKFPSSNCANVITSPVCYLDDVAYGVYVTAGRIAIASAYGRDVYDSALEKLLSNITTYDEINFLVLGM